ncbi:hypothetical protein CVS30_03915 [Arthrobacter psychrolactophilus]|uniref:Uncharacterized protein n=1 Tax=Arthrobacter psychrolactophilus TaxID=92442 RepID=A0A2V5ITH9_9MICC|nr:hypothetical protein [Arthrobacter psychrolactophilus]PYI39815.1 hypothetical protein CVS30_03915 [Arthrobacter psychrolactophilus]
MAPKILNISIVAGQTQHPEAVFNDLCSRARGVIDSSAWTLALTIVHVSDGSEHIQVDESDTTLASLSAAQQGKAASVCALLAGKPGPVGILGRLLQDNLESRRVARSLINNKSLMAQLRSSAVVVSADPSAIRSVWGLRKQTGAHLVHGPIAMVHAIKVLTSA